MELAAELAKGDKAARSETLVDTAPVIDGNKVVSLKVQSVTLPLTMSSAKRSLFQTVTNVSFTCYFFASCTTQFGHWQTYLRFQVRFINPPPPHPTPPGDPHVHPSQFPLHTQYLVFPLS